MDKLTVFKKTLLVETAGLEWPLNSRRIREREDRTLLREKYFPFRDYTELREHMLMHDMKILAKWMQRGLTRKQGILINVPIVSTSNNILTDTFDVFIKQDVIPYDPDLYRQYAGKSIALPPGQKWLEIAVYNG